MPAAQRAVLDFGRVRWRTRLALEGPAPREVARLQVDSADESERSRVGDWSAAGRSRGGDHTDNLDHGHDQYHERYEKQPLHSSNHGSKPLIRGSEFASGHAA